MAKKSYAEQLKHPNWQRRRLEVLQAADFSCEVCGDKENTLHVHHKRYVKGREVWEYELNELIALCEPCHEREHVKDSLLAEVLAAADAVDPASCALGLTAGYLWGANGIPQEMAKRARETSGATFDLGVIAYVTAISKRSMASDFIKSLSEDSENGEFVREALSRWMSISTRQGD
jgi:hypothetical protein